MSLQLLLAPLALAALVVTLALAVIALVLVARLGRRLRKLEWMAGRPAAPRVTPPGTKEGAPREPQEAGPPPAREGPRPVTGPPVGMRPRVEPAPPSAPGAQEPPKAPLPPRPPAGWAAPPPAKKPFKLEEAIGLKLLAWAGMIVVLFGVLLFAKYAFEQGWLGPVGKVAILMVCGAVFLAAGEVFSRKGFIALARVCTGGGLAIEYFAAFYAWNLLDPPLISEPMAWGFMAVVTGVAILLSVRYASLTIAIFSLVGGLAAPLLISPPRDPGHTLFLYLLGVNAGVLVLAYFKKWRVLNLLALLGTMANFSVWLASHYWHGGTATEKLAFAVTYLTIFWFVYFLLTMVYHTLGRHKRSRLDLPVTLLNVVWYFGVLYALLQEDYHHWLGPAAAILGAVYLSHGLAMRRWAPTHVRLILLQVAQGLGLLTLAIPIQLEGVWIPMAWAVEASLLVWLGCRLRDWRIRGVGLLVHAASVIALFWLIDEAWHTKGMLVLNARTATFAVVALAMALSACVHRRLPKRAAAESVLMTAAAGAAHVILMILIGLEIERWFVDARTALDREAETFWRELRHLRWIRYTVMALGLAAYGFVATGVAAIVRRAFHHAMALVAFAASIVVLSLAAEHMPYLEGFGIWNEVGAVFAGITAALALSAVLSRYATGKMRSGRGFAITYELAAVGVVLWLYLTELSRASDYMPAMLDIDFAEASVWSLVAAGFACVAGGLMMRGLWIRSLAHRVAGLLCLAAAGIVLLIVVADGHAYNTVLWQPRGIAFLLLILSLALSVVAYGRRLPASAKERRVVGSVLAVLVHLAVLMCFTLEAEDFWAARADKWFAQSPVNSWHARHATLSVGYALYGFALLAAGMWRRRALLRWLALVILAGTIAKVFLYDLSRLEAIWRILSFLGLGLLLLAGSLLYHKYRHILFRPDESEPPEKEVSDDTP